MCRGMVFWQYPLDQHVCTLSLASSGYDASQLQLVGHHSYARHSQRELQFLTDIRELGRDRRACQGQESRSCYAPQIPYCHI